MRWSTLLHAALATLGALSLLIGLVGVIEGLTNHPHLDAAHLCRSGQKYGCARFRTATSLGRDSLGNLRVDYGDGRRASIDFDGPLPPAGDPLRVEQWDDAVVSVWDVHRERRYKSIFWPRPADPYAWFFIGLGLVLLAVGLRRWLGRLLTARRRAPSARSSS